MDCHAMWHAMADSYMQPDTFRMHLNSLIQGLRNVTFLLQKQKSELPNFETWYTRFQEEAKADPIMRWVVKSRNRVVKESDLELLSEVKVRWVADWANKKERKFTFPPRMPSEAILGSLLATPGNRRVGVVTVSRRWVDSGLPDRELMSATREAFITLSSLLADAHEAFGAGSCGLGERDPECVSDVLVRDPLNCMDINPGQLQEHLDLSAMRGIDEVLTPISYDEGKAAKARKRYGVNDFTRGNPIEIAPQMMDHARSVLARDKSHMNVVWLFRGDEVVEFMSPNYADQNAKYLAFHRIADRVETHRADGILLIAEMWYVNDYKYDDQGKVIPARDRGKDRREALHVLSATRDGRVASLIAPFSRKLLGGIQLEDTFAEGDVEYSSLGILTPIIERWREMENESSESTATE
ncbi:hypothetical protein GCM10017667_23610 [Streptomyces filamentosus]|uniref:Uncharacterized protein n=2 Tax=Streptomyces filamentosus TaxID=67294 RepID=A0A919ELW1_STRFL|nr:hypothetical protein GCM10017667_23610 [Streptomyces filamentosus]